MALSLSLSLYVSMSIKNFSIKSCDTKIGAEPPTLGAALTFKNEVPNFFIRFSKPSPPSHPLPPPFHPCPGLSSIVLNMWYRWKGEKRSQEREREGGGRRLKIRHAQENAERFYGLLKLKPEKWQRFRGPFFAHSRGPSIPPSPQSWIEFREKPLVVYCKFLTCISFVCFHYLHTSFSIKSWAITLYTRIC